VAVALLGLPLTGQRVTSLMELHSEQAFAPTRNPARHHSFSFNATVLGLTINLTASLI
jgi:hypothetical protein